MMPSIYTDIVHNDESWSVFMNHIKEVQKVLKTRNDKLIDAAYEKLFKFYSFPENLYGVYTQKLEMGDLEDVYYDSKLYMRANSDTKNISAKEIDDMFKDMDQDWNEDTKQLTTETNEKTKKQIKEKLKK